MNRYVVLLRGINVGGAHRVPMAELRDLIGDAGYGHPATYLQSGNLVLSSELPAPAVAHDLARRLTARFDFAIPVTVRTVADLDAVVAHDPLDGAAADPKRYVVTFLGEAASADALARLRVLAGDGERLHAHGRELYSHHPQGQGRSKLAAALTGATLGSTSTARNWSTVNAVRSLARPPDG